MERPSFIFTTPFNVNVVEEKGVERVFLEGLISTNQLDLVNDIVTKNCLESMQRQILERSIKLDIEHESFRGETVEEKEINKTKIPAGKITDATVVDMGEDRFGLRIKAELNRFNPRFEEIKGNVLERYLDAYSIAFIPTKVAHVEKEGVRVRMLEDDRLLNVALTGNAINTGALNQKVFMKAIDAVEEYKKQKLDDPELENKLEVKTSPKERRTQARNAAISEGEEDEEDDDKKKKKKKEEQKAKIDMKCPKCGYKIMTGESNNDHISDSKQLNHRRLKMAEDQPEETGEERPEGEETAPEAPETPKKPEGEEGESAEGAETPAEAEEKAVDLKALTGRLEAAEKDLAEIKALLKRPVHKSISETRKPAEEKAKDPLEVI